MRRVGIPALLMTTLMVPRAAHSNSLLDNTQWFTLANGLQVVIKEDHNLPTVSAQIWVKCGGINENLSTTYGASHYLEHMLFKGTKKYTAGRLSHAIESRGGFMNAATSKEFTHYYVDIPVDGLDTALDVLAEAVSHATFPPQEMERERLVILEEIKRRNDSPDANLWDNFTSTLYQKTPYHWRVIGTTESITAMSRQALMDHYKTYYAPNNMVVVVAGDVKTKAVLAKVTKLLGSLPRKKLPAWPDLIEEQGPFHRVLVKKHVGVASVMMGFLGPAMDSEDQFALDVLASLLGDGRTARLNQVLREKKKIVYGIGSSFIGQLGTGMFVISASCEPKNVPKTEKAVHEELQKFLKNLVAKEALERAKVQIKTGWLFDNETNNGQAENLAYFTLFGKVGILKRYLQMIEQVTEADLKHVLKTYWNGQQMSTAVLLPQEKS